MHVLSSLPKDSKKKIFWWTTIRNDKNSHFKNIENFVPALHRNSCAEVKLFFRARCAEDTESIDIKTTVIASVVYPLLISAIFRAVLNQCAAATKQNKNQSNHVSRAIDTCHMTPSVLQSTLLYSRHWTTSNDNFTVPSGPAVLVMCKEQTYKSDIHVPLARVKGRHRSLPKWHVSNCVGYRDTKFESNPSIGLVCSLG